MEFSFYGHAFFYYIRVFLFHDGGTIIGIYLLDLYVLTFHDMGYVAGKNKNMVDRPVERL